MELDQRLLNMLVYKRPYNTLTERNWNNVFLGVYEPQVFGFEDKDMAYVIKVGESNVLFSAHTDTVHRTEGVQEVFWNETSECLVKQDDEPLGADDAAGCWLLLEMIDAKVPGTYIFHRGEECGGIGSKYMADHHEDWLKQFDYAIAFDRKATHSVITHQGIGRCCSDDFADALSAAFNNLRDDFMYVPDDTGVYTDTAEYVDIIAECTNVSVGYYDEHTGRERLYVPHLMALREACINLAWSSLPVTRKPGEDDFDRHSFSTWGKGKGKKSKKGFGSGGYDTDEIDLFDLNIDEMRELAYYDPDAFAERVFCELHGIEMDDDEEEKGNASEFAEPYERRLYEKDEHELLGDYDEPSMFGAPIKSLLS